jgi:cystathionine gamma-synthase
MTAPAGDDLGDGGRPIEVGRRPRPPAPATVAVTSGRPPPVPDGPLNSPVVFASALHAGGVVGYARDGNPTWSAFEETLAALEGGGTGLAFASGMGAVAAVLELLPVGAPVVHLRHGYTGTQELLATAPAGRWEPRPVDVCDTDATVAACAGAGLLWLESPTNPLLEVADLAALAAGAHREGALVAVDNTFATPLVQRPLDLGADVAVYSATKLLAGHSDVVLGATVTRDDDLTHRLVQGRRLHGAIPGPMETFLALRGLRTLPLRVERAQANAATLAERLDGHADVTRTRYPGLPTDPGHERARSQMRGFGAMVSFEVAGGAAAAEAAARSTRLIVHATSLGGIESTMERRAKYALEGGTPAGLLRLSVGCEDVEDLWDDLVRALRIGRLAADGTARASTDGG